MRYFVPLFAFVMLARMGFAQDDFTMMRLIQQMFENSPRLRADRERNIENAARAYEDACLAYLCPNEQMTLNYGRELLALKREDD